MHLSVTTYTRKSTFTGSKCSLEYLNCARLNAFCVLFFTPKKNVLRMFSGGKCIAVPNTDDVLEIFGFGYSAGYVSPSVSPKDTAEHDMKPLVQVVTGKYPPMQ